jgi:hypothetical protein
VLFESGDVHQIHTNAFNHDWLLDRNRFG